MNDPRKTVLTCAHAVESIQFPVRLPLHDRYRVFNSQVRAATRRRMREAAAFSSCNPRIDRSRQAETGAPKQRSRAVRKQSVAKEERGA
jgi:hypothetical protein